MTTTTEDKPLRKDAERNRQLILDAARELFAERGLGVTLNDIAHHAGVGVGTVYRRFPDKAQLVDGLFEEQYGRLVALMDEATADPDPWRGIVHFLTGALELQARDRGMLDITRAMPDGLERVCRLRDRLLPSGLELVRRAREAGKLATDVRAQDMPLIQLMVGSVIDAGRDVDPELWRRYVTLVIRGMSAQAEAVEPLSHPPVPPEQIDAVMAAAKRGRSRT